MKRERNEQNILFGLLLGTDPRSGASLATTSRVMALALLLFAGGADAGCVGAGEAAVGEAAAVVDEEAAAGVAAAGGVSVPASIANDCA